MEGKSEGYKKRRIKDVREEKITEKRLTSSSSNGFGWWSRSMVSSDPSDFNPPNVLHKFQRE